MSIFCGLIFTGLDDGDDFVGLVGTLERMRSMNPGFAGIDNPLYYLDRTLMLFGDAKGFVSDIVRELSGGGGH